MSRGKIVRNPPRSTVFEDGVEDREQLAHAGHQGHLLRFAGRYKTLVEFLHDRVAARAAQRAHVQQGRSDVDPPSPHATTRPRSVPESRLSGATPTRAASRLCVSVPSSGTPANRVRARTGPTPGTLLKSTSFSPRAGLLSIAASRSRSVRESSFSSHLTWALMRLDTGLAAEYRRL